MHALVPYLLLQTAFVIGQTIAPPSPPPPTPPMSIVNGLPADFPSKIWVQEPLRDTVTRMWSTSPTFRRQCLEVQAAGAVQVQIRVDPTLAVHPLHRATCELRSFTSGGLIARIFVAPVSVEELIGHELEHVRERLEGINVVNEARSGHVGYYLVNRSQPQYETDRAIRVGRQVMAEMTIAGSLTRRTP